MTPWSVRPSAGWSSAAALCASASIRQAPSSTEYSECTCRWTAVIRRSSLGSGDDGSDRRRAADPGPCGYKSPVLREGPIPRFAHGLLEYAAAALLIAGPFLLGFESGGAEVISVVLGVLLIAVA